MNPAPPRAALTPADREQQGRAQRRACPRRALGQTPDRGSGGVAQREPLAWLAATQRGRVPELIEERTRRMLASPFAFFRGAAALMAHDLASLPHSGVVTQLCGDAHLSNFGFFASPERTLLFDINDFDETHRGPFDWDLRRLACSFVIAARDIGIKEHHARDAVSMLAKAYRDRIRRFARMDTLDAWYYRLTAETLLALGDEDAAELAVIRKARRSTSRLFAEQATERVDGRLMIKDEPPFVYHDADATRREIDHFRAGIDGFMADYRASLPPERQALLDRYQLHDVAVLTPGIGSVGRRCFLLLLVADGEHPLFLQCKEAAASVLKPHLGAHADGNDAGYEGRRIVHGQRLMQAASDIFLGWAADPGDRPFYVRQLRDMKASYALEDFKPVDLIEYAEACGYGLARAHAKGGDAWAIGGYLGPSDRFDRALTRFACGYADINESDWHALKAAP